MSPEHREFLEEAFRPPLDADVPRWRIPFFHHPPYTAGPNHNNSDSVIKHLVRRYFKPASVRVGFAGHEHNFQHTVGDSVHCFVTGGAGKVAEPRPRRERFGMAHVHSWAGAPHFLLVRVEDDRMVVRPVGTLADGELVDLRMQDAEARDVPTPIEVGLAAP